jgi:hypothetical protein
MILATPTDQVHRHEVDGTDAERLVLGAWHSRALHPLRRRTS